MTTVIMETATKVTTNSKHDEPIDKSDLPNGDPYWAAFRKTYTVISTTGERSLVKLSKKREKLLKKQKCSHCRFSKAETGWTYKHLTENQGGGVWEICPNCGRVND